MVRYYLTVFKFVYLVSLLFGISYAQTNLSSGLVLERHSHLPMAGVTVVCKLTADTSVKFTTITNRKGIYTVPLDYGKYYQLTVSYLGYHTNIIDSFIISSVTKEIPSTFLSISSFDLGNVTVKAKQPIISFSHDKISLNVAESPIASGNSVYDLLKRIPGIIEQNDKLSFRAHTPIYLINGRPINLNGDDLKNFLSEMMANSIATIEVYPNPSAKYDGNAGVVINILLIRNKNFGTVYNFTNTVSQGRYTRTNSIFDFSKRSKKITITGSASGAFGKQYSEIFNLRDLKPAILNVKEFDTRNRFNKAYKIGMDVDVDKKNSFGISFNYLGNKRERVVYNTSMINWPSPNFDSTSIVLTSSHTDFNTLMANTYFKSTDTLGGEFNFNVDYINYNKKWSDDFENSFLDHDFKNYAPNTYFKNNSPSMISVWSVSADYSKIVKNGKLEIGVKATMTNSNNDIQWAILNNYNWLNDPLKSNHFLYTEKVFAGYSSVSGHYRKFTYQAGIRLEASLSRGESITLGQVNKSNFLNLFPNFSFSFVRNPSRPISLSYKKAIVRFGFDFVNPFIFYQSPFSYTQGNPTLKPQINHRLSLSSVIGNGIIAGAEFTTSKRALGISYKTDNQRVVTSFDNFQSTSVFYSYLNFSKKYLQIFSANVNVAAGVFNINSTTELANGSTGSNAFGTLQFNNQIQFKRNWTAETILTGNTALASGIFTRKAYYSTDLGVAKSWENGKWNFKLTITDIFNSLDTRMNVDFQMVKMESRVKFESRFLHATLRFRFGNSNVKKKGDKVSKIEDIKNRLTQ